MKLGLLVKLSSHGGRERGIAARKQPFAHKKLLANQRRKEFPGMTGEIRVSERELAVCSGALDISLRCLVARKRMCQCFSHTLGFFFLFWRLETRLVAT